MMGDKWDDLMQEILDSGQYPNVDRPALAKAIDGLRQDDFNTVPVAEPHRDPGDEDQERRV